MAKTACVPLWDVLGYECDESLKYDEKAIYFCKTDFAIYFDEFDDVPQDTLMCVVKTINTDDDFFADSCDYFKRIVEFKAQQELLWKDGVKKGLGSGITRALG